MCIRDRTLGECLKEARSRSTPSSAEAWIGVTVDSGDSVADTAAQNAVIGEKQFRKFERNLYDQFGLSCLLIPDTKSSAIGIGGKAKCLGLVLAPVGIARTSGTITWTVVDDDRIPPLTPVNLLHVLGAIVNLPDKKIDYKSIGRSQPLNLLPSGHVSHSIVEFPEEGWTCPPNISEKHKVSDSSFRHKKFSPVKFDGSNNIGRSTGMHGFVGFSYRSSADFECCAPKAKEEDTTTNATYATFDTTDRRTTCADHAQNRQRLATTHTSRRSSMAARQLAKRFVYLAACFLTGVTLSLIHISEPTSPY